MTKYKIAMKKNKSVATPNPKTYQWWYTYCYIKISLTCKKLHIKNLMGLDTGKHLKKNFRSKINETLSFLITFTDKNIWYLLL